MEEHAEVRWARELAAGHPDAFDRFVETFRTKIFQYSFLMCGQREDAEEVSQEALLKVFENFAQLRDPRNVRSWVFRIARNACMMKRRKSVFAPARELSLDAAAGAERGAQIAGELADTSRGPDELLLSSERSEALHAALRELPETYRTVVLLRDIEELSTEEAAEVLEVSRDVVKTRLHRARMALRSRMREYMAAPGKV